MGVFDLFLLLFFLVVDVLLQLPLFGVLDELLKIFL